MDRTWSVVLLALLVPLVLVTTSAEAQPRHRRHHRRHHTRTTHVTHAAVAARPTPVAPPPIAEPTVPASDAPAVVPEFPSGRAIANLSAEACLALLRGSDVTFDALAAEDAPDVRTPVRVRSPLGGVTVVPRNDPQHSPHAIVDCRLAVALLVWAPTLRAAHIVKIEHYSAYRANARVGGDGAVSGHASGMALDAALFVVDGLHTDDGEVLDVLTDWADRTLGADPCADRPDEPARSHVLRSVVCEAVHADLFQVVLTPHHDAAHQNHVHLELRPGVDWSFVK